MFTNTHLHLIKFYHYEQLFVGTVLSSALIYSTYGAVNYLKSNKKLIYQDLYNSYNNCLEKHKNEKDPKTNCIKEKNNMDDYLFLMSGAV